MDKLKRQVRRARRRIVAQRFVKMLPAFWCATLSAAAMVILIAKYMPLGVDTWTIVGAALAAGPALAVAWIAWTWTNELEAAIELDRRFGLKERVSSTLALSSEDLATPAGQALLADAERGVEQIEVGAGFGLRLGHNAWLPLAPALVAFLVAVFVNPEAAQTTATAKTQQAEARKQVKTSAEELRRKTAERAELAKEQGLDDLAEMLEKIDGKTKELAAKPEDQKQALVKLNDLSKDLEQRRKELADSDRVKDQLKQLKSMQQGPADRLAKAMENGDIGQAMEELKKLQEQMEKGEFDDAAKQQLAKQLAEMEEKLSKVAQAHKRLQEEMKKEIAEKRAAGKAKEADELEKKLQQLAQQAPQMQQLANMAEKLGQCSKCMQAGDKAGAAEAMESLAEDLEALESQLAEAELLDDALAQFEAAKDAMNCKHCKGAGCGMCQGNGNGDQAGNGLGRGRGQGDRPEQETDTSSYDTQVRQKLGRGAVTHAGFLDGPQAKGQVQQEIETQFEAAAGGEADPLNGQKLPKEYRDHTKKYFDSWIEGQK